MNQKCGVRLASGRRTRAEERGQTGEQEARLEWRSPLITGNHLLILPLAKDPDEFSMRWNYTVLAARCRNEGSEFSDSDSVSDVQPSETITAKRPVVKKVINQKRCKRPAESDVDVASVVRELLDDLVDCTAEGKSYCDKGVTKKGEKRKRSAYNQPLNVRKNIKRQLLIESHAEKPPCNSDGPRKCRRGCTTLISQERQNAINDAYWALSSNEKRVFVMRSQRRVPKQRERLERRKDGNNNDGGIESRKANTYQYVLHDVAGHDVEVCKVFFLATLGYESSNDRILKFVRPGINAGNVMPKRDGRGQHAKTEKVDSGSSNNVMYRFRSYSQTNSSLDVV
ncbi:hypothetical protein GE061_011255 [Apolygus lucorum]|uniref:Uncharacterized protein n=1 Tax=Apolygus lucorum TaxID=248454 RepID=A0A8S9Y0X6_APOLU|nr:hypothetical protein GE061_011255 [Apolygus lucorum]